MKVKTKEEIVLMREGGKRLAAILEELSAKVTPGVTGAELDKLAREMIEAGGDKPAFLHYHPDWATRSFPATLCVSINDEVVHGIPSDRKLEEGDIVGLDLGLQHNGLFLDMAVTVPVGNVSEADKKLMQVTKEALRAGIAAIRVGGRVGDIGEAIEKVVEPAGFAIVEELGGHGVGHEIHEAPFIPHFADGRGEKLEVGMTLAIEPMINAGESEVIFDSADGYTVRTADGSKSAHYEATIALTESGPEILTPLFW